VLCAPCATVGCGGAGAVLLCAPCAAVGRGGGLSAWPLQDIRSCMYVCNKDYSAAPAHARTRAHKPAPAPRQSSGVSQTSHYLTACPQAGRHSPHSTIGRPSLCEGARCGRAQSLRCVVLCVRRVPLWVVSGVVRVVWGNSVESLVFYYKIFAHFSLRGLL